ncbi:uncharacterized protein LOC8055654 [Sorghum bicolor]|uniref:BHLH domain-containing protein n=1 Tax=Sorghum bicolor TaxID=4558 RepID=C5WSD8_SORBI|nr:uncharacterized protein LOC8055654 [Sorghum bicolor]EER91938.1 hypothetical protein SORBI_3001G299800 [Sorghum bicolor]|eukprot:XP_002464940.1 uncharacterized protein LOC8055654 [Sorghum bicolor]
MLFEEKEKIETLQIHSLPVPPPTRLRRWPPVGCCRSTPWRMLRGAAPWGSGAGGGSGRVKKKGMPSKNLMAERCCHKKLNDRLYMLRSVVPKISKAGNKEVDEDDNEEAEYLGSDPD